MAKTKRPPQTKKKLGGPRIGEGGPRRDKADAVADFQQRVSESSAVLITDYRGMTVHELADLRTDLRQAGGEYKVYKNTLASIAAKELNLDDLSSVFQGPSAFAFTSGDPVLLAKKLSEFAKKVPALVLKGGILDRKVLSAGDVAALGNLESREVMLAKVAGMMQAPIQQLANLFAAGFNQMGAVLVQLRDKLAEGAPPPAETSPVVEEEPAAVAEATEPEADAQSEPEVTPEPGADAAPAEADAAPAEQESETSQAEGSDDTNPNETTES